MQELNSEIESSVGATGLFIPQSPDFCRYAPGPDRLIRTLPGGEAH